MNHLVAYDESQDSAVLANIAAIADDSINVQGDNIRVPREFNGIGAVYVGGINVTLARVLAPSLRDLANLDVGPVDVSAEPTVPTPIMDMFRNPTQLTVGENLRVQAAEDGAGAQRTIAGIWLVDGPSAPVEGEIFTVRVTGATAMVANAWTVSALTFDQELPAGRYQVVGAKFVSTSLILSRLVIPGVAHRPGCIGYDAVGDKDLDVFRHGRNGVWAEFDTVQGISLEGLATAADATQEGVLDLIRIGDLAP